MCAQKINNSNLQDVENKKYNQMDATTSKEIPTKVPFHYSRAWLILWSFLVWPIGLLVLWNYLDNLQNNKLPRTNIIIKDSEEE